MNLKILLLLFILLGTVTLHGCTKDKDASRSYLPDDLFVILFEQVGLEKNKLIKEQLEFLNSTENDVESFLMNFPVKSTNYENKLLTKQVRAIKSRYVDYFILFKLANDNNPIDKRLYSVNFNVTIPNEIVTDIETATYKMLTKMYGEYTKKSTMNFGDRDPLNTYEWKLPKLIVIYRSSYNPLTKKTVIITQFRDRKFHESHSKASY